MPGTYTNPPDKKGGGDPNILKLKDGATKIHPLDNMLAGWRQHGVEHPSDSEQFASLVCPGARSCPLCRKPVDAKGDNRFPVSRRYAANAWDYESNSVKVLIGGPQIFDELKTAASVGIDPATCDWVIVKSGTGRQTEYKVINQGPTTFDRQVTPDMLHDISKYEQPISTEAIFEVLERFGIDYDALETPSYTYDEALAFKMPYGKHRGLTVEQLVAQELDYAQYIHSSKLEQGALGDPVFLALQTVLEAQELVSPLDAALAQLPSGGATTTVAAPATPAPTAADPKDRAVERVPIAGGVVLKSPIGIEGEYPPQVVDSLLAVGFERVQPEAPAVATGPVKVLIAGNEVELPADQIEALIASGVATRVEQGQAPAPEPPKLPLPDEVVQVSVGGTEVPMPYGTAYPLVDAGSASFVDEAVAQAHARVSAGEAQAKAQDPSGTPPTASPSTTRTHDPEKPFECDQCDAAYKTQGGLTQHKNREHKAAEPQPSAVPAANNGSGSAMDRVKEKIQRAPFARDYQSVMGMMEEATGTKNFAGMTEEQLLKFEKRIDAELAKVAA